MAGRRSRLGRRLISIPRHVLLLVLVTLSAPLWLSAALIADAARVIMRRPPIVARLTVFGWLYLLVGNVGLAVLGAQWVGSGFGRSRTRLEEGAYRLQEWWANTLFAALRRLFRIRVQVDGMEAVAPGPVIVLIRHASIIDSLLPSALITRAHGIRLRYVLKRELLADPALDVAGNRLPNHFVDRAGDVRAEIGAVIRLVDGVGPRDGVLIYPEGTRFTDERKRRITARMRDSGDRYAARAEGLRHVLPPRPGGTGALLGTGLDVVVVAHSGLESLATVADAWSGRIVGSTIRAAAWRFPAASIPSDRRARVDWLWDRWEDVDRWLAA